MYLVFVWFGFSWYCFFPKSLLTSPLILSKSVGWKARDQKSQFFHYPLNPLVFASLQRIPLSTWQQSTLRTWPLGVQLVGSTQECWLGQDPIILLFNSFPGTHYLPAHPKPPSLPACAAAKDSAELSWQPYHPSVPTALASWAEKNLSRLRNDNSVLLST